MAAGPGQAADIPGVYDGDLGSGEEQESYFGLAARRHTLVFAVEDVATTEDPGRVLTAAGIGPAPAHPITPVTDERCPIREDDPSGDDLWVMAEHLLGGVICEVRAQEGIPPGDKNAPPGRPIDARNSFHHTVESERVYFQSPEAVGRIHPKDARVSQRAHDSCRESTVALCLIGVRPNQGFEVADGGEQVVAMRGNDVGHNLPLIGPFREEETDNFSWTAGRRPDQL
jgi:hypothetical protein